MRLVGQVVQCLTPPWQLHVRCPLYAATLLGHLIQLDAAMPGSSLYQVTGVVLTVAQVVLPTLCLVLVVESCCGYAWQLFTGRHAPTMEPEVLKSIHPSRRLALMLSMKGHRITTLAKSAQVRVPYCVRSPGTAGPPRAVAVCR